MWNLSGGWQWQIQPLLRNYLGLSYSQNSDLAVPKLIASLKGTQICFVYTNKSSYSACHSQPASFIWLLQKIYSNSTLVNLHAGNGAL